MALSPFSHIPLAAFDDFNSQRPAHTLSEDVSGGMKDWLDEAVAGLPLSARIFEIGSGSGRDADYIESLGYDVMCSDIDQTVVSNLLEKGFNARIHNAVLDPMIGSFDLVLANAVLPQMTCEETTLVTSKVQTSLKPRGRFAFSLKKNRGEKWVHAKTKTPHFCQFWHRKQIETLLRNTGFSRWVISEDSTGRPGNDAWMQVIAYR